MGGRRESGVEVALCDGMGWDWRLDSSFLHLFFFFFFFFGFLEDASEGVKLVYGTFSGGGVR